MIKIREIVLTLFVFSTISKFVTAFPFGIFPILPSEWYYKPTPSQQVVLGLILVKVLAIRLASVVGILPIPYHLNDLFTITRSFGKRSIHQNQTQGLTFENLVMQHRSNESNENDSIFPILKIFAEIHKMDKTECFLKTLCLISNKSTNSDSLYFSAHKNIIGLIRYLNRMEHQKGNMHSRYKLRKSMPQRVMDPYMEAITNGCKVGSFCEEYKRCPLMIETLLKFDTNIIGIN